MRMFLMADALARDGNNKNRTNGWFMAVHPATGLIVGLQEMKYPENNELAIQTLEDAAALLPALNCIVYDRMCCAMSAVKNPIC